MTVINIPPAAVSSSASPPVLPGISPGKSAVGFENQEAKESMLPPVEQVEKANEVNRHEDRFTRSTQEASSQAAIEAQSIATQEQYIEVGVKAQRLEKLNDSHVLGGDKQQANLAAAEFDHQFDQERALKIRELNTEPKVATVPQGGDPELQLRALEQIQHEAKNSAEVNVEQRLAAADAAKRAEALRVELAQQTETIVKEELEKEEEKLEVESLSKQDVLSEVSPELGNKAVDVADNSELVQAKGFDFEQPQINVHSLNEFSSQLLKYQNQQVPEFDIQKTISQLV